MMMITEVVHCTDIDCTSLRSNIIYISIFFETAALGRGGASIYRRLIGRKRRSRFSGRGLRSLWPRRICMAAAVGQQTFHRTSFHSCSFMHVHLIGKNAILVNLSGSSVGWCYCRSWFGCDY